MPDLKITVGDRPYEVACQPGEEQFLQYAADLLNTEAESLISQLGRVPEPRMLLMSGLMLADKTAGFEEQLRLAEARLTELEAELAAARNRPETPPERVEVPVIPASVIETMAEMTARAEAIADAIDDKVAQG